MRPIIYNGFASITWSADDRTYLVQLLDYPEGITEGRTMAEAKRMAVDCLDFCKAQRMA